MNINAVNGTHQNFGAKINLACPEKTLFKMNLIEKLYEKNPNSQASIISQVKSYADKHGIKEVFIGLRKAAVANEHGDLLLISAGPKTSTMRFDNNTTSAELSGNILHNIQENYNIRNPRNI